MLFYCKQTLFFACFFASFGVANAQSCSNYGETQEIKIKSDVYKRNRTILVKVPFDYDQTKAHYPTLYALDANDPIKFQYLCSAIDNLVQAEALPPMIICGIVPEQDKRNYELTPPATTLALQQKPYGGADRTLNYIEKDLIPFIDGNYRTCGARVLYGHSFAGLFTTYAMIKKPNLFRGYIAISPALWYNNESYVEKIDSFAQSKEAYSRFFYFSVGDRGETELSIRPSVFKVYDRLKAQSAKLFHWQFLELHDKNHTAGPVLALPEALSFIFRDWLFPEEFIAKIQSGESDPITAIEGHYTRVKNLYDATIEPSLNDFTYSMAIPYMQRGNTMKAKAILAEALNIYPNSAFIYECIGDALAKEGDWSAAKINYKTAVDKLQDREKRFAVGLNDKIRSAERNIAERGN